MKGCIGLATPTLDHMVWVSHNMRNYQRSRFTRETGNRTTVRIEQRSEFNNGTNRLATKSTLPSRTHSPYLHAHVRRTFTHTFAAPSRIHSPYLHAHIRHTCTHMFAVPSHTCSPYLHARVRSLHKITPVAVVWPTEHLYSLKKR
jgi:hypothetical protein